MFTRSFGRLAFVTVMLITVSAFGAAPAHAAEAVKSAVAARVIFAIPYWIAERKGSFGSIPNHSSESSLKVQSVRISSSGFVATTPSRIRR